MVDQGEPGEKSSLDDQLAELARVARTRFEQSGKIEDLEDAIAYDREALALRPPSHSDRPDSLYNLGIGAYALYLKLGDIDDLEEAITCYLGVLSLLPADHPKRSDSLSSLGVALCDRHHNLGKTKDLEESIIYHLDALSLRSVGHPQHSDSLIDLGTALHVRSIHLDKIEDLEVAITYYLDALPLRPVDHSQHSDYLMSLGSAFHDRYQRLGLAKIEDLEKAITHYLEALSHRASGHPERSNSLKNLGMALNQRHEKLGKIEDLEKANSNLLEALSLRPVGHAHRSDILITFGVVHQSRYQRFDKCEDLENAITYHLEGLSLRPVGHPQRSGLLLENLGNAVHDRYMRSGMIEDLETAITYLLEALSLHRPTDSEHFRSLNNIGFMVLDRYWQLGKVEDLHKAITYHLDALSLLPLGHRKRNRRLQILGRAIFFRYRQLEKIEDLEKSIAYFSEALSLSPLGHPVRADVLCGLGATLYNRDCRSGQIKDLTQSITYFLESLSLRPDSHPKCLSCVTNLAISFGERYKQFDKVEDLEKADTYALEALSLCPLGHPKRSRSFQVLSGIYYSYYEKSRRIEDLDKALESLRQATHQLGSDLLGRLAAAKQWATLARIHHDSSLIEAYSTLFHLLDHSSISYPQIESQFKFVTSDISAASDAAAAAIDAERFDAAVELLEQGRAVLWEQMDGHRQPLAHLCEVDKELAHRLRKITCELTYSRLSYDSYDSPPIDSDPLERQARWEARLQRRLVLSEEWDDAVEQVRKIVGFSNFLQVIPFATLQEAAAEGPIIIVNVSKYRSDAIILLVDGPPIHIDLPDVQPGDLATLNSQLAIARDGHTADPSWLIFPILRKLWDDIVHPVVDRLRQLGVPERSRIWWCPTSELCGLPLHAAGPYRRGQKNMTDLYISSYIPTVSALIKARSDIPVHQAATPKMIAIGQSCEDLEHVQSEIDGLQQLGDFVDVLVGADARHDVVVKGLQQHTWAHFACHGYLGDDGKPFKAALQLAADARLTLLDLINARLQQAELAFLSMCHSAAEDLTTPNEAVSLAALVQFCGFRSVVGTLWAMDDEVGPMISQEFYKHMFQRPDNQADFRDSAEALNLAVRALRKSGVSVDRWIMFVHVGA